jgi:amidase
MNFREYQQYDGLGLADLVAKGSPQELLDIAIACMQEVNPHINAVVIDMTQIAREHIANDPLSGAFAGVPFLPKAA